MEDIRKQFPILNDLVYFDSAALVLKPQVAIDGIIEFYSKNSISSRTIDTPIGYLVNEKITSVRQKVANLVGAKLNEVMYTSGTTESINLFSKMFARLLNKGDVILVSAYNHSSNLIPWVEIAKEKNAIVKVSNNILNDINSIKNLRLVALGQETNNYAIKYDLEKIYEIVKQKGAFLLNDAAQAIIHQPVSLKNCDVIAFSTNKFYGPTGLGFLVIKDNLFKDLKPAKYGGGTVNEVNIDLEWTSKKTIMDFEPGTPDLAGIYMFDKSLDFFNEIGYQKTQNILKDLSFYLHKKLAELSNVIVYSKPGDYICLLNIKNVHPQDVATYLGSKNIYTLAGIFCSQYLRNIYDEKSYLRISLGIYNNYQDIDKLVAELKEGGDFYAF